MANLRLKILVLDDNEYRHEAFSKKLAGHDVWHTYTAEQTSKVLAHQGPFDVVYLDHDLGETHTGMDVARYITGGLAVQKRPLQVIVHSHNTAGAERMEAELRAAGITAAREPFAP